MPSKDSAFSRYFFNTSWLLIGRGLQMVSGLVIGILLTRYLGPEKYGVYSFALSFAILFAPLANLGLGQIVARDIIDEANESLTLGTSITIRMGSTAITFALIALCTILFVPEADTQFGILLASSAILFRSLEILSFYFQARVQGRLIAIPHIVSIIVSGCIKIILILLNAPMVAFLWVVIIDAVLYGFGLLIAYQSHGGRIQTWRFDKIAAFSLVRRSWPLMFSLILVTIYLRIDQVMIKYLLGFEEVGWYAAAVRLSTATYMIPIAITSSLFPAILLALKTDEKLFSARVSRLYQLMIYLAIAFIIPTWIFAKPSIQFLLGDSFAPAATVLTIHMTSSLFTFTGYTGEKWLLAKNLQVFGFWAMLAGAVANIGLNVILIPAYGINGAAWATLIAQAISYQLVFFVFKPTRPMALMQVHAVVNCLKMKPLWPEREA